MGVHDLPTVNALLNATAALFLFWGRMAIKNQHQRLHRQLMTLALLSSSLFLGSYLYYHFNVQMVTRYSGTGVLRWVYYFILGTHVPLATLMVPFIVAAVWFALTGRPERHKKIVRWVWPIWMYVSITGVVVYLMLYVFS